MVAESGTFPGCVVECRLIGALQAEQTERDGKTVRNDRFIGMPVVPQVFSNIQELDQLPDNMINQLEHFFKNYNEQAGKEFRVTARLSARAAAKLIN